MALKTVRIGALKDVFQFDDGDFDSAIETTEVIRCGAPTLPTDVLRLGDVSVSVGDIIGPAGAVDSNLAEFNGITGKKLKDGSLTHANVADAISKKHTQGTDQGLDTGGANASTAADVKDAVTKKHTHADVTQNITVVTNVVGPVTAVLHFTNGLLTSVT